MNNTSNNTGCYLCKHLDYFESDYESGSESGFFCNKRDDEPQDKFKKFPCERKLKCFEGKGENRDVKD